MADQAPNHDTRTRTAKPLSWTRISVDSGSNVILESAAVFINISCKVARVVVLGGSKVKCYRQGFIRRVTFCDYNNIGGWVVLDHGATGICTNQFYFIYNDTRLFVFVFAQLTQSKLMLKKKARDNTTYLFVKHDTKLERANVVVEEGHSSACLAFKRLSALASVGDIATATGGARDAWLPLSLPCLL